MRDFFLSRKHPVLVWNLYEVAVRCEGSTWACSIGWQGPSSGYGSSFYGRFASREAAGRQGCDDLINLLHTIAGADVPAAWADEVQEFSNPLQLQFAL